MTQEERRLYLIKYLLNEQPEYSEAEIPEDVQEQKNLLRSLFNVRMPKPIDKNFEQVQNEYLQEEIKNKGITDTADLKEIQKEIYLWQGDITTLKTDAIVNAANGRLLGCFHPCHKCIDNAIHTFAGVQLRNECNEYMKLKKQENGGSYEEPAGSAVITKGYNLPCKYVLHTVGPVIYGELQQQDCKLLSNCYLSCLKKAEENKLESIAFCCISTGEFHFPNDKAAQIAVDTVKKFKKDNNSKIKVIFNVFKDTDLQIYRQLLAGN